MILKPGVLSLLLLTSTHVACSGGSDNDIKVEDLCDVEDGAFVEFVDKILECNPEFSQFFGISPTPQEISTGCDAQFTAFVDDGTMILGDKDLLATCLEAIDQADCETLEIDNMPECDGLTMGQIEDGDACDTSGQCGLDSFCDDSSATSCGVCAQKLADGQACHDNSDCANKKCLESKTCGSFGLLGDSCVANDDCVGRLSCQDDVCAVAEIATLGDTCTEFSQCGFPLSNMYCDETGGECKEFLNLGAACADESQALGVCDILSYETCDQATRKCIAPTLVAVGETCNFVTGLKCSEGLQCDAGENGKCVETGLDAACDSSKEEDVCGLFLECKDNNKCGYEVEYTGMCPAEI